jgi:hypothetical protein
LEAHEQVDYLEIPISMEMDAEKQWDKAVEKVSNACAAWTKHYLSLIGRKVVLNCYILPKIDYYLQALPLPIKIEKTLETLAFRFLWKNKVKGDVSREQCVLPIDQGDSTSEPQP